MVDGLQTDLLLALSQGIQGDWTMPHHFTQFTSEYVAIVLQFLLPFLYDMHLTPETEFKVTYVLNIYFF